jgi:hypothetical protein
MPEPKTKKLTLLVADSDHAKLGELAAADDVSTAHVVRNLIRQAHEARFGATKPKKSKR